MCSVPMYVWPSWRASSKASSSTRFARGVKPIWPWGGPSPLPMTFSTSARTFSRSMPMPCSVRAATPSPSAAKPKRMCSVPTTLWPRRLASSWERTTTFCARSVKRPNTSITFLLRTPRCRRPASLCRPRPLQTLTNEGRPIHIPFGGLQLPADEHLQMGRANGHKKFLQNFRLQAFDQTEVDTEPHVGQQLHRLVARHHPRVGENPVRPVHPVFQAHPVPGHNQFSGLPLFVHHLPGDRFQVSDDFFLRPAQRHLVGELENVAHRLRPFAVQASHH